jgi:hypothetical protein
MAVTADIPRQYIYNANPANKPKLRARVAVASAIKRGTLIRMPCEKCGNDKSQAHHEDYSRPLEIQWLCPRCHGRAHRPLHCKRGHQMTDDNVRIHRTTGRRSCIQCAKDFSRQYWKIHKRSEWRISK